MLSTIAVQFFVVDSCVHYSLIARNCTLENSVVAKRLRVNCGRGLVFDQFPAISSLRILKRDYIELVSLLVSGYKSLYSFFLLKVKLDAR